MIEIKKLDKKVFFISDLHLPLRPSGVVAPPHLEDKVVDWLDYIKPQAQALFLLGDIFDFWFEYKYLVPKGAIRFQAKLWEWYKAQIPVYFFVGNHDGWTIDYLTQECGVQLFSKPASISIANKRFLVGHGDSLNPTTGYAILRRLYHSDWLRSFVRAMPPDWFYSRVYRYLTRKKYPKSSFSQGNDPIFHHCKDKIEPFNHHEFYIFGHIHCPYIKELTHTSRYCNLGDWISYYTYACFDGVALSLFKF